MKFCLLTEKEFQNFLDKHPLRTFVQTVAMTKVKEKDGWESHFVGIKENNKILCATMMISLKGKLKERFFYAPRGFLIDYNNKELLKIFTNNIKDYIKSKNGYMLRIEPEILYKERDIDGNLIEGGFDNTSIYNNLIELGYKHNGFYLELDLSKQVRWAFALNLKDKTKEEIFEAMRPNTKNHLRKAAKYNIVIREFTYDELSIFKDIVESSGQRKSFHSRPLKYYQNMYKAFYDSDDIKYMAAELDIDKYIKSLKDEIKEELDKKEKLSDAPSNRGLKKEIDKNVVSINKRLEQAKEIESKEKNKKIILAGAMFMTYGNEIVYLFSGSRSEYLSFGGQYCIQWHMIQYGIEHGYKLYNFYGISGNLREEDNRYGVYEFKKGFGGTVIEYIGDFDLIISKPIYIMHELIKKIKNIIKKKES
jgi:lipid II:glycine glycyltransferase (peptidoglycan interpeptide bridge formation enzyme)